MAGNVCPCGTRLEQKPYESDEKFAKRLYCNNQCRGKYHNYKAAERGFGFELPKDRNKNRIGTGLLSYFYGKQI